jgi:hypothetical protein
MNKLNIFISLLFIQFQYYYSLIIETNGKKDQYCVRKRFDDDDQLNLHFFVTGELVGDVSVTIYDPNGLIFYTKEKVSNDNTTKETKLPGQYKLCFQSLISLEIYISFEFYSLHEQGHVLNLAKDADLHDLKKDTNDISLLFEEIENNIRFTMDRKNKHNDILTDLITSIRHMSYLKILVIVLVSLLQVFLVKKFYGGNSKKSAGYNPTNIYEMGGI